MTESRFKTEIFFALKNKFTVLYLMPLTPILRNTGSFRVKDSYFIKRSNSTSFFDDKFQDKASQVIHITVLMAFNLNFSFIKT